ncbi:MAG: FHA domain-containing protein [Planctomycetia bacterium]|nr:FHA domain-containing protein [Planctomycetia bacterium]
MTPLTLVSLNGGKQHSLAKDLILVGRQEGSDIHIEHKSVSKQHCVLLVRDEKLWLRDLGSTNGCHVNGKRVRRSLVKPHDILGFAGFNFRVTSPADKKKSRKQSAGTAKLDQEELKRLEQRMKTSDLIAPKEGTVVQVNKLPDEYTPVAEDDEEA